MSQVAFRDPADLPQVSIVDNPEDHCLEALCPRCGNVVDAVCPKCKGHVHPAGAGLAKSCHAAPEFYRRFVNLLISSRNKTFTLACYLIATGDAYADGVTMQETARSFGVCKATVSKQCVFICKYLGITPSAYMRREAAAGTFRLSNRRPRKHD